jgi:hypothetical protein
MWVAFGVGGAGLTFGAIMGGLALSASSDLADRCTDGFCPVSTPEQEAETQSDIDSYEGLALASTVGFAVGVAGVATGVVLLFVNKGSKQPAKGVVVMPRVGLGSVGVEGRF